MPPVTWCRYLKKCGGSLIPGYPIPGVLFRDAFYPQDDLCPYNLPATGNATNATLGTAGNATASSLACAAGEPLARRGKREGKGRRSGGA